MGAVKIITHILLVMLGGGIGSACRYLFSLYTARWFGNGFPWGTLGVNFAGCLVIGLIFSLVGRNIINSQVKLFFMTGFLGGLTTFSTLALESTTLWKDSQTIAAIINIAANNFGGLLLVLLGLKLGELI
jgi:CrcB protein